MYSILEPLLLCVIAVVATVAVYRHFAPKKLRLRQIAIAIVDGKPVEQNTSCGPSPCSICRGCERGEK
jgi:hypothetical protein